MVQNILITLSSISVMARHCIHRLRGLPTEGRPLVEIFFSRARRSPHKTRQGINVLDNMGVICAVPGLLFCTHVRCPIMDPRHGRNVGSQIIVSTVGPVCRSTQSKPSISFDEIFASPCSLYERRVNLLWGPAVTPCRVDLDQAMSRESHTSVTTDVLSCYTRLVPIEGPMSRDDSIMDVTLRDQPATRSVASFDLRADNSL
jgi:hypothetical protein